MKSEWRSIKLAGVLGKSGYIRGPFGSALRRPELKSEGIPVYEQQHAIYNTRTFRFFIDGDKYNELTRFTVQESDLIISCSGTIGKVSVIRKDDPKGIISQALLILRPDTNIITPKYLYYFLLSPKGYHSMVSVSSGSVQVNIAQRSVIENIDLPLPPLPEQRVISHILGSLDDKIELNRKMNNTLKAIARTIFKSWFVDFDPVRAKAGGFQPEGLDADISSSFPESFEDSELGKIPKGWKLIPLPKAFDFKEGPGLRNWQYKDKGLRFLNIRCIVNGDLDTKKANCISFEEFHQKYKHFALQEDDVVISTSGTLGRLAIVRKDHLPLMLNTSIIRMRGIAPYKLCFVWSHLQSSYFLDEMFSLASGSVQLNFGPMHLKQMIVIKPPDSILEAFEQRCDPIIRKVLHNHRESRVLASIRDTLLSKLLSGEIRIKEAAKFLENGI